MAEGIGDILHINLNVYDTEMSLNIKRGDEEYYRKAEKLITDTINNYASMYKGKRSEKEILYMALITIALKFEKESVRNDATPYINILSKMTSEIESALDL